MIGLWFLSLFSLPSYVFFMAHLIYKLSDSQSQGILNLIPVLVNNKFLEYLITELWLHKKAEPTLLLAADSLLVPTSPYL